MNNAVKRAALSASLDVSLRDAEIGALGQHPLLRGLLVNGAGFRRGVQGVFRREPKGACEVLFLFCLKGSAWCELPHGLQALRAGDLLVIPSETPYALGGNGSAPAVLHWVQAIGGLLPRFLEELHIVPPRLVLSVGEDLEIARLFAEVLKSLQQGRSFPQLLRASSAFGHLLGALVAQRRDRVPDGADVARKVAEAIVYMSEHLRGPLRVPELARLVNLSPHYFSEVFKQQTGCSPRDYLHLLRIHRACQLLREAGLSIKEIAAQLGYQDQFHFSRQFKAFQGQSPTEYRSTMPK